MGRIEAGAVVPESAQAPGRDASVLRVLGDGKSSRRRRGRERRGGHCSECGEPVQGRASVRKKIERMAEEVGDLQRLNAELSARNGVVSAESAALRERVTVLERQESSASWSVRSE
jgi:hypothetical protein